MKQSFSAPVNPKRGGDGSNKRRKGFGRTALFAAFLGLLVLLVACGDNAPRPGSLEVTITGLPGGVDAAVTVTGPAEYNETLTASKTLTQLAAGSYTVTAGNVSVAGELLGTVVTGSPAAVLPGATAAATVRYEAIGAMVAALETTVPFAYPAGREVAVEVVRTGGYEGSVVVTIDTANLPSGVTLSSDSLAYAATDSAKTVTLVADSSVTAADLDSPVELDVTVTAGGLVTHSTLTVRVSALVMNTNDSGEGSLRHVIGQAPSGTATGYVVISFDPGVLALGGEIELASEIDVYPYQHVNGPVDDDGAPLVTIFAAGADQLFAVKDTVDARMSNLVLMGTKGARIGGAIHSQGYLELDNMVFLENEGDIGGAIYALTGELTVSNSVFRLNVATGTGHGGAIYNNGAAVSITNSLFESNNSQMHGGAIFNTNIVIGAVNHIGTVEIEDSAFLDNFGATGGAVHNSVGAVLTVQDSSFEGNWTRRIEGGGAIRNLGETRIWSSDFSSNRARSAGGIKNESAGTLWVNGSTFFGNQAESNGGAIDTNGLVYVTNSTFTGNSAERGGAIFVSNGPLAVVNMAFSTISGNTAGVGGTGSTYGGGIGVTGVLNLRATIAAGNKVIPADSRGPDISEEALGTTNTLGYNFIGDTSDSGLFSGTGHIVNQPLQLGPLQDNGGPTRTMAIPVDALPVDKVPALCLGAEGAQLRTDQRGLPRPSGTACDIGAYEVQ